MTTPAKIEQWMRAAADEIDHYDWKSIDEHAAIIAAHAPGFDQAHPPEPSVPVSKLKEFERELQWGSSIKRLRRLFTDIIHEAEQEKQP